MEFQDSTVVLRTARRMGKPAPEVQRFLDTYAEEWLRHAREVEMSASRARTAEGTAPPPSEAPRVTAKSPRKRTKATADNADSAAEPKAEPVASPS